MNESDGHDDPHHTPHDEPHAGRHDAPHDDRHNFTYDDRSARTGTEDLLARALAARAEQITHHSLRPGSPPSANWVARGRGPLLLALAAGIVSVALVGGAAMSLTDRAQQSGVADSPTTRVTPPPSLSPSPPPSGSSSSPGPDTSSTDGGSAVVPPPGGETAPESRVLTVTYGPRNDTFSLRTGGARRTLTATVSNNLGQTVEAAGDILSITADGGALRPGDVRVSLQDSGGNWKPVGGTSSGSYTAELSRSALSDGAEREHRVRISLGSGFPAGITGLRISFFSDGGSETLTLS